MSPRIISFTNDEIPTEGTGHTKALHIAVKTRGMVVARVLIYNGSALNVCPWATLQRLGISNHALTNGTITVRAFDGSRRETMGEIQLPIEIRPVTFSIRFQVLEIPSAYNFLLGRPWIHKTARVPSSLHHKIKFISDGQLVTVFAEPDFAIYQAPAIPVIETNEPSSFQSFECASVQCGTQFPYKFPNSVESAVRQLYRNGFECGKGLGITLQGDPHLRTLAPQNKTRGLGYHPSKQNSK